MHNEIVLLIVFIMQTLLTFGNVCIMLYTFKKFLDKPKNDIEERVAAVEAILKEHTYRLNKGSDKFKEQDETNQILICSTLALINFEIQRCLMEDKDVSQDLLDSRNNLQVYLSRK